MAMVGVSQAASPIPPETVGRWQFKQDARPIKAIVLGGSVTAWPSGNFGQFLEKACPTVEIVNRGKARIGARQLHERFVKQVLKNRRVDIAAYPSVWLLFQGGLNSIGTPTMTNRWVGTIFRKAHEAGLKTVGMTLGPWGSNGDRRRWRGANGLKYQTFTRRAVDFVMGRLTVEQAFGAAEAKARGGAGFKAGELPDIAVDLYDSALRDREAPLREDARMLRRVKANKWVKKGLKALPDTEREGAISAFVAQALAMPRWFMKTDLQAFDSIHPNAEGHRLIAAAICPQVSAAWDCRCDTIGRMRWSKADRAVVLRTPIKSE